MRHKIITLAICLFSCFAAWAQSRTDFELTKVGSGHLYFETTLCGDTVSIMVETPMPGFMIGRDFYERNKDKFELDFTPAEGKKAFFLYGVTHEISHTANGVVRLDGALYDGPVFVLNDYDDFKIPIQYLKNREGNRSLVCIDIAQGKMSVLSEYPEMAGVTKYKLRKSKETSAPIMSANIEIKGADGKDIQLKEDLIVDFGNPMLLFINKKHKTMKKLLKKSKVELHEGRNKEGVVIAEFFYTEARNICGKSFGEGGIITNDKGITLQEFGLLGVPFFTTPVLFDFDQMEMITFEE